MEGFTSYVTTAEGNVSQYIAYMPFGDVFYEQHSSSEQMPYKFNAKELDSETGLYYYGARYYDPSISLWLSVDPLAEKYPHISPYAYTFNNPVNFIDPTGMEGEDPPTKTDDTSTISKVFNRVLDNLKERYVNPERDIKLYEERDVKITQNSMKIDVLSNLTNFGQLKNVTKTVLTDWALKTNKSIELDYATKVFLDMQTVMLAMGVAATSTQPHVKAVAATYSSALMAENIALELDNFLFLNPRIKKDSPGYYKKHIDSSYVIPQDNSFFGGGSFGGQGATGDW